MDTDIVSGFEAGMHTILVLTGLTSREEAERCPVPALADCPTRSATSARQVAYRYFAQDAHHRRPPGSGRRPRCHVPEARRGGAHGSSWIRRHPDHVSPPGYWKGRASCGVDRQGADRRRRRLGSRGTHIVVSARIRFLNRRLFSSIATPGSLGLASRRQRKPQISPNSSSDCQTSNSQA